MSIARIWKSLAVALIALTIGDADAHSTSMPLLPHANRKSLPQTDAHAGSMGQYEAFYVMGCLVALEGGDLPQAESDCGKAIDLNSADADAYKLRGYAYLLEHRFERAEADFHQALAIVPDDAESRAGYAQSLSGRGQFAQAVAEFDKAITLAPRNAGYWNARCWARSGTGKRLDRALADCNRALSLTPGAPGALNSRGLVRLRMNQFAAAISDYTASLDAKPSQASALFGRGLAWLRQGQRQRGEAEILRARQMDPEIDDLFEVMGVVPPDCAKKPQQMDCLPASRQMKQPAPKGPWAMLKTGPEQPVNSAQFPVLAAELTR
jgi:tetratricopeptide (TPR) repeat protein